jgi:hypothetical protein
VEKKIAEGTAVDLLKVPGYTGKSRTQSLTDMEGVAFERNGRVIMTAQMGNELGGGLQKRHPRFRFFRGLVQFTDAADKIFGINKDKDKLDLDQSIRDLLAETFKPHIKASGLNHDNWSKSKTEEKNPIILDGIVQEAQGKHGLAPKKKRPPVQNVKKPVNSGDNKVLNHPTRATAPWLEAVAEENLGKLASPWRFDSKSKIILLNVDNKYVRENYVGRTVDQKEMVIRLAVAITSAQIELEEHHDEEVLSQVLDILYKKLRAGA